MNFRMNYQFLVTGKSDITFNGRDQRAKVISFQSIPPFNFPLQ